MLKYDEHIIYLSKREGYNHWSIHPDLEIDDEKHIIIQSIDPEQDEVDLQMMRLNRNLSVMEGVVRDHYLTFNTFDNLDIKYVLRQGKYDYFEVITYHGDLIVSNSKGQTRPIKGMYSKMKYICYSKSNLVRFSNFQMFRDRYLSTSDRCHPHVASSHDGRFSGICLGTADIKNQMRTGRSASRVDHYENLLYIDSFIRWESLEGGPYGRMVDFYSPYKGEIINYNTAMVSKVISELPQKNLDLAISTERLEIDRGQISDLLIGIEGIKKNTFDSREFRENLVELTPVTRKETSNVYFRGEKIDIHIGITEEDRNVIIKCAKTVYDQINDRMVTAITNRINNIINTYFYTDDTENENTEVLQHEEENEIPGNSYEEAGEIDNF